MSSPWNVAKARVENHEFAVNSLDLELQRFASTNRIILTSAERRHGITIQHSIQQQQRIHGSMSRWSARQAGDSGSHAQLAAQHIQTSIGTRLGTESVLHIPIMRLGMSCRTSPDWG